MNWKKFDRPLSARETFFLIFVFWGSPMIVAGVIGFAIGWWSHP